MRRAAFQLYLPASRDIGSWAGRPPGCRDSQKSPELFSTSLLGGPWSCFLLPEVQCGAHIPSPACPALSLGHLTYLSISRPGRVHLPILCQSNQEPLFHKVSRPTCSQRRCLGASHGCTAPESRGHQSLDHAFSCLFVYIHPNHRLIEWLSRSWQTQRSRKWGSTQGSRMTWEGQCLLGLRWY